MRHNILETLLRECQQPTQPTLNELLQYFFQTESSNAFLLIKQFNETGKEQSKVSCLKSIEGLDDRFVSFRFVFVDSDRTSKQPRPKTNESTLECVREQWLECSGGTREGGAYDETLSIAFVDYSPTSARTTRLDQRESSADQLSSSHLTGMHADEIGFECQWNEMRFLIRCSAKMIRKCWLKRVISLPHWRPPYPVKSFNTQKRFWASSKRRASIFLKISHLFDN